MGLHQVTDLLKNKKRWTTVKDNAFDKKELVDVDIQESSDEEN